MKTAVASQKKTNILSKSPVVTLQYAMDGVVDDGIGHEYMEVLVGTLQSPVVVVPHTGTKTFQKKNNQQPSHMPERDYAIGWHVRQLKLWPTSSKKAEKPKKTWRKK